MATNNAEKVNFKVLTTGNPVVDGRQPSNLNPITLEKLAAFIDQKVSDERVATEVKRMASVYPSQALWSFKKNITTHISRAQKKISKLPIHTGELGDEPKIKKDFDSIKDINEEF